MITKKTIGHLMTELDILESSLISFEAGEKDFDEVKKCVKTFREEAKKLIRY
jgi:hypothetical protein